MTSRERPSVAILMGTYNGAEHLAEQLGSFAAQTHAEWSLYVSDDGSTDATHDIVKRFAKRVTQNVDWRAGPRNGFVDNFLTLSRDEAIDADLFAFSDQDDIWYSDKLARAVAWFDLRRDDATPAVYFSRTELIGPTGDPRGCSTLFRRPPGFRNALVQNIGGANTMVFNRAARRLLQAAAGAPAVSHDWALYLLVTAIGGVAFYDGTPTLKYRQHDGNVIGTNKGYRAVAKRFELILQGTLSRWNAVNRELLRSVESRMSGADRASLQYYAESGTGPWLTRLAKLRQSGVYRQTWLGNVGLVISTLMRKI